MTWLARCARLEEEEEPLLLLPEDEDVFLFRSAAMAASVLLPAMPSAFRPFAV